MGGAAGRMRGAGSVAIVAAVALTLSGCSLVSDGQQVWTILQQEETQRQVLTATADELRELDSVERVASRFLPDGVQGDEVELHVTVAASPTSTQLTTVVSAVHDAFTSPELKHAVRQLTVQIPDGGTLNQEFFDLTDDQLRAEIDHWLAVQHAIETPLSLHLTETSGQPPYHRVFEPAGDGPNSTAQLISHYAQLLAVPDETAATSWWALPGLSFQPHLPPAEVVALLGAVRETAELIDYTDLPDEIPEDYEFPQGAAVGWYPMGPERVMTAEVNFIQSDYRASDWLQALQLAELAVAAGANFAYSGGERQFRLYTGECGGTESATNDDRMLVRALAEQGTILRTGGAGFCMPTPPE